MPDSELDKSPSCGRQRTEREARDKERKGDRKKRSSLRPLFFIKLIHGHKSLARRPSWGLISQASKTKPWEAMSTKVWFPFVFLWSVLYSATLHWCSPWIGYTVTQTKEGKSMKKRRGWSELEKYVCILKICVCWSDSIYVSVLYVYWQLAVKQVILLTCIQ